MLSSKLWLYKWTYLQNRNIQTDIENMLMVTKGEREAGINLEYGFNRYTLLFRLWPARLLCPWNFPGKNIGMGCHALFQTQGSNPGPLHWEHAVLATGLPAKSHAFLVEGYPWIIYICSCFTLFAFAPVSHKKRLQNSEIVFLLEFTLAIINPGCRLSQDTSGI